MRYQPSCEISALHARANLYAQIRTFFAKRGVLEVETPILSSSGVTDVHLASVAAVRHIYGQKQTHYLQTSPEFAMKRLLASEPSLGAIYQICKVFRDNEHGRKHNSEFTMLEWYRPSFSLAELMAETHELLEYCLERSLQIDVLSYKAAFKNTLNINPLTADCQTLKDTAHRLGLMLDLDDDRLGYMDLLFSHAVEPSLGVTRPVFLTDFPKELASLAKTHIDDEGDEVASRFELYIDGLELANAYDELVCADTLRERFLADNAMRASLELPIMPVDERLLSALPSLPECAGIALGVDRLLMIKLGAGHLKDVVSFLADRA